MTPSRMISISRLAQSAGVMSISSLTTEEVRGHINMFLTNVLKDAFNAMKFDRAKTLQVRHVENALPIKIFSGQMNKSVCTLHKRFLSLDQVGEKCRSLILNRELFYRLVQSISEDVVEIDLTENRISAPSIILLQYAVEEYIRNLLKEALLVAKTAKRLVVQPKDIQLVTYLKGGSNIIGKRLSSPSFSGQINLIPNISKLLKVMNPKVHYNHGRSFTDKLLSQSSH